MEYVFLIIALLAGTATHIVKKVVEVRKTDEDYQLKDWLTKSRTAPCSRRWPGPGASSG